MITRNKEKESQKKHNYSPSSDIESSPISNSHHRKGKKIDHKKKLKETKFKMTDQMKRHHMLEILEFRIHFDQDPNHGHPAQSVSILDELPEHEITDMNEEERSMEINYKLINPIQIIPDFWPKRVYDDDIEIKPPNNNNIMDQTQNNIISNEEEDKNDYDHINAKYYDNSEHYIPVIKLTEKESQQLLEKITAASDVNLKYKPKHKKTHTKNNKQKTSLDKDGDFSNTEDADDDDNEFDKNEVKKFILSDTSNNRKQRSRFRFKKNRKEFILSIPSLLYDTDESCDETDGELF